MKLTRSLRKISVQLIHPWVAATAMVGLLSAAPATFAAAPPANTLIGNQASATYLDPSGAPQTSTSNQVQTTIQQVGSFTLDGKSTTTTDVVNTKTGAAGTTVYTSHVLTNTGNGFDSFDIKVDVPGPNPVSSPGNFFRVAVFKDNNFDGLPDNTTELCGVTTATGTCTVAAQAVAGNGGQFGFVVAYTLPATATTPLLPFGSGKITAAPIAASLAANLYAAGNVAASDVDNINLTTTAAFNLNKSIAQPGQGINPPSGGLGAWPSAPNNGQRSASSATCPTDWASLTSVPAGCKYTVYTLIYTNTGGAPGRFVLEDVIGTGTTAGMTYVDGSAVWSNAPGTGLSNAGTGLPANMDFKVVTAGDVKTLTFVDNSLPVNVTRSISFVVRIDSDATLGTESTTNVARFSPIDVPGATSGNPGGTNNTPPTTSTNGSPYTTTGTYGITLSSLAGTATTGKDTTAGTPNADANDTETKASAPAGGIVPFGVNVYNTGNAVDVVNITGVAPGTGGGTAFPANTVFQYFKADGATPLTDTNGDGIPDTGSIPAGQSTTIVVKAILPATLAPTSGQNYTLTITGASVNDSTQKDATKEVLNAITGTPVDITNSAAGISSGDNADVGPGPSSAPTTIRSVQAGSTTVFSLFVKNNDTLANSYALASASSNSFPGTLPSGWTVKFVSGAVNAAGCAAAAAITTTSSVAINTQIELTACVTVPASQSPLTAQPVYFQVKSINDASTGAKVVDVKFDAVTVTNTVLSATIGPATSNGQTTPGGSVVYPQTLTNTGSVSCTGPYTVTASLPPADVTAGWQAAVYQDVNENGQLDSGDTLVTGSIAGPLAVGAAKKFLVKVFSAAGAAVGATDTATINVAFPDGSCGTPSSSVTTTVVTGQIRVLKTQAIDTTCNAAVGSQVQTNLTGKPGQCIVYQVTATNQGNAAVTNLVIKDAVPAYTVLHATQPAVKCSSTGVTPAMGNTDYSSANNAVQCGAVPNSVPPNATMTLTFQVQINN